MAFRKLGQHNINNKLCPSSNLFIQPIVVDIEGAIIHTWKVKISTLHVFFKHSSFLLFMWHEASRAVLLYGS